MWEKMTDYKIKAYIWITANSEEEAEGKLKNECMVLSISEIEEL